MELMETSTTSHWVLRYSRRFTTPTGVTQSHSCLSDMLLKGDLWGSCWAQSEPLQLASQERKFLQPQLLSPDLAIQKALWGCEDHGQAHCRWWMGWGKGEGKSGSEWRCWNCSQPITHKTDSVLILLCSLIFYCPISLLHQGQMKGTMACIPHSDLLELHSLTHLLWGVNGLLKLPLWRWACLDSHCRRNRRRGLSPMLLWGSWSPFPQTELRWMPLFSVNGNICETLNQWQHCSPNLVHFSQRVGEGLGNKITAEQILTQMQWTKNTGLRLFPPF